MIFTLNLFSLASIADFDDLLQLQFDAHLERWMPIQVELMVMNSLR